MKASRKYIGRPIVFLCIIIVALAFSCVKGISPKPTSYTPVVITEDFESVMTRMKADKPEIMKRQMGTNR